MENKIIIYQTEDGLTKISVTLDGDTVWLTQAQMAELFQRDKSVISKHIANIFEDGELERNSVVANFATTASDGKTYQVDYYSLDVIISVGYRVKSLRGTQFRIWANRVLKEYMIKGFALNDDLLKQAGGGDYFRELLERIRDIRSSERVFYRQILDIYETSIDYNKTSEASILFFKTVQNKMHFAVTGHTAPEIVYLRADSSKPFMGLKATGVEPAPVLDGGFPPVRRQLPWQYVSVFPAVVSLPSQKSACLKLLCTPVRPFLRDLHRGGGRFAGRKSTTTQAQGTEKDPRERRRFDSRCLKPSKESTLARRTLRPRKTI